MRKGVVVLLIAPGVLFLLLVALLFYGRPAGALLNARLRPRLDQFRHQLIQRNMNRLAQEKSPYLLQHASNPVDWYPWGDEAFAKARRENKPVFLSVGYSTCHWCHVMEHESFEDPALAQILNQYFVSIKVDREERPDVDRIYMTFVQATTGGGGWPMSVFLTPDRKPFLGGTYFPPTDRYGRPGFRTILMRVQQAWSTQHDDVIQSADRVVGSLQEMANQGFSGDPAEGEGLPGAPVLDAAYHRFLSAYDHEFAGFGHSPKFPRPSVLNFLLRYYARSGPVTKKKPALEMVLNTLRAMAAGGMHDHLGGGFHRYSVDARWHVPHFEKMLYDQAQLSISYTEAYQITHDPFFSGVVRDILDYVLRDMRDPDGGFYSAEDADSLVEASKGEKREGAFYVWTAAEIEQALGTAAARTFDHYYGVEPNGNVSPDADQQGEFHGRNILILRHDIPADANNAHRIALAAARQKLFEVRARRPRPSLDDKVLVAWNGLMISALARASQALDDRAYLAAAQKAAGFIHERLYDGKTGLLLRRYRAGDAAIPAFVDDYAFLIQGLLDLYETDFNIDWLAWAARLQEKQDQLFWDAKAGGYFSTSGKDPSILMQMREDYDGAEPSPNSIALGNLLRLAQITGRDPWRERGEQILRVFASRLAQGPETLPQMVAALDYRLAKPKQIVIAGAPGADDTVAMLRLVRDRFLPHKIVLLADGGESQKRLAQWLPFVETMSRKDGRATAYICENFVCQAPTADPAAAAKLLDAR
jgi:uncharacterized protein YyaL (SSP411 family)